MPLIQYYEQFSTAMSLPSYLALSSNGINLSPESHHDSAIHPTIVGCDYDDPHRPMTPSLPKPIPRPSKSCKGELMVASYEEERDHYNMLTWAMYNRIVDGRKQSKEQSQSRKCQCANAYNGNGNHVDHDLNQNDHHVINCAGTLNIDCTEVEGEEIPSLFPEEIFYLEM